MDPKMMKEWAVAQAEIDQRIKEFHAHLDVCDRCRNQPFNLCPIGAEKLQLTASTPTTEQRQRDTDYHAHLDMCERCREQPSNLCPIGAEKLQNTAIRTP